MFRNYLQRIMSLHCIFYYRRLLSPYIDGELTPAAEWRVRGHLDCCPLCHAEHDRMRGASRLINHLLTDEKPEALVASWRTPQFVKSSTAGGTAHERATSILGWRAVFTRSITVPAPVAAVFVLLLVTSTLLAIRTQSTSIPERPARPTVPPAPAAQTKIVEVPVVRERIVTRTIYVASRGQRRDPEAPRSTRPPIENQVASGSATRSPDEPSTYLKQATLRGFKPAEEVKIRIIKNGEEQR